MRFMRKRKSDSCYRLVTSVWLKFLNALISPLSPSYDHIYSGFIAKDIFLHLSCNEKAKFGLV